MFEQNVTSPFTTTVTTPSQTQAQKPLRDSVKQAVNKYLKQLDNTNIENLYELVMAEVEAPMLEEIMTFTRGNQTKASTMLGINRGTLRKKLKQYGMSYGFLSKIKSTLRCSFCLC
jgi:Fis family transcriptional regulator